jgi:hypothetical protein
MEQAIESRGAGTRNECWSFRTSWYPRLGPSCPRKRPAGQYLGAIAIDVGDLPSAAERLDDLSPREREVLALIGQAMASREIAQRLALSESTVYRVIADLLDAVDLEPPAVTASDIHGRAGSRPATADEAAGFHSEFGPFDTDVEG